MQINYGIKHGGVGDEVIGWVSVTVIRTPFR